MEEAIEGDDEKAVAPVGCVENEENRESENVDPDVVVDVFCELRGPEDEEYVPEKLLSFALPLVFGRANDDAMLDMSVGPAPRALELNPNPPEAAGVPVCCECC